MSTPDSMRHRSPSGLVTGVDINSRICKQQLDSIKAIIPTGDRKGWLPALVASLGTYTAIKEKAQNRHIKRHDGVVEYDAPCDEFKCTTVYKETHLSSVPSRSSKIVTTLAYLLIQECAYTIDQTRVQEACEVFVCTHEGVLVARLLHVHNL
ncbi:hypothetical protein HOY82DRAFT_537445 [Tuber indicum]|nr:hypothetical protein HOY82DRAFT_537445 [Tuber indicum]